MPVKDLERECIRQFAKARPDLAVADAEDSEQPDFLIRKNGHVIGIEVTRYSPPQRQNGFVAEEQESLRRRVMAIGRRLYESGGGAPLYVDALFNDHRPLKRARVMALARELAHILLRSSVGVDVYKTVPFTPADKHPHLQGVGHIAAIRVPTPEHGLWYAGEGAWVREATIDDFVRLLAEKERKLRAYRTRCDEVWLLVVFDSLPGGEYVEGPSASAVPAVESRFDRIFALERITSRCVELRINRAA